MKGSVISESITKVYAELFPRIIFNEKLVEQNIRKETKKSFWILNSHRDFANLI